MTEFIVVMAAKANDRVVLWEVNPAHPGGEAFISGDGRSVQVALTAAIQRKLDAGELIKVLTVHDDNEATPENDTSIVFSVDDSGSKVVETPGDGPPFDGYDTLSAAAIVERLVGLTDDEKATVRAYEATHKARKTVLEALA